MFLNFVSFSKYANVGYTVHSYVVFGGMLASSELAQFWYLIGIYYFLYFFFHIFIIVTLSN
jgi:hypothetical protein